jgi:hypothetical protein
MTWTSVKRSRIGKDRDLSPISEPLIRHFQQRLCGAEKRVYANASEKNVGRSFRGPLLDKNVNTWNAVQLFIVSKKAKFDTACFLEFIQGAPPTPEQRLYQTRSGRHCTIAIGPVLGMVRETGGSWGQSTALNFRDTSASFGKCPC